MIKRRVPMANSVIKELNDLVIREHYLGLVCVFQSVDRDAAQYLDLSLEQAKDLIFACQVELYKTMLKYPYYDPDEPGFDHAHQEQFDQAEDLFALVQSSLGNIIEHWQENKQEFSASIIPMGPDQ